MKEEREGIRLIELDSVTDTDIRRGDANPDGYSWWDIVKITSKHEKREDKDGPCFVAARLKDPSEWVRKPLSTKAAEGKAARLHRWLTRWQQSAGRSEASTRLRALKAMLAHHGRDGFIALAARGFREGYLEASPQGYVTGDENARLVAPSVVERLGIRRPELAGLIEEGIAQTDEVRFRNDDNVEAVTMIVLDLDEPGALETARRVFQEHDFVVYSTHSYCREKTYKFRMLIHLDEPIPAEQWRTAFACLQAAVPVDSQCKNESRLYFWPSHHPQSGLRPHWEQNRGRPVTLEDLYEIGRRHGYDAIEAPITRRSTAQQAHGELSAMRDPRERVRDYLGRERSIESLLRAGQQLSWHAFLERHADSIRQLEQTDSRHEFALSVTSREVMQFRENTDIERLVQFLYRGAEEYASRGLTTGNTPDELPEMLESALLKLHNPITPPAKRIQSAIERAEAALESGKWDFPETPTRPPALAEVLAGIEQRGDYERLRAEYAEALEELSRGENHTAIARCAEAVVKRHAEGERAPDVSALVEFVFRAAIDRMAEITGTTPEGKDWEVAVGLVGQRLESERLDEVLERQGQRYRERFREAASQIEDTLLNEQGWRFTEGGLDPVLTEALEGVTL